MHAQGEGNTQVTHVEGRERSDERDKAGRGVSVFIVQLRCENVKCDRTLSHTLVPLNE